MPAAAFEDQLPRHPLRVETPEGIELALAPAGVVARFYAFAVDSASASRSSASPPTMLGVLGGFGFGIALVLFFSLEWLYPVVFELSPGPRTPGKRALDLRVVMDTGLPITPAASLTRNLLRAADFLPMAYAFGLLSMLMRHDFKRLGDLAAGTLVVHDAQPGAAGRRRRRRRRARRRARCRRAAQAAIVAWAGRVTRLTEARADELAEIAAPVAVPRAMRRPARRRAGRRRPVADRPPMTPLQFEAGRARPRELDGLRGGAHATAPAATSARRAAAADRARFAELYRAACEHLALPSRARIRSA